MVRTDIADIRDQQTAHHGVSAPFSPNLAAQMDGGDGMNQQPEGFLDWARIRIMQLPISNAGRRSGQRFRRQGSDERKWCKCEWCIKQLQNGA